MNQLESIFETFPREPRRATDVDPPLISPWAVRKLADILSVDVSREPYQVTNMKTFLKTFHLQYRLDGRLDPIEVESCLGMIEQERGKQQTVGPNDRLIDDISNDKCTQFYCIECSGIIATSFCTDCRDCFCQTCCDKIHSRGRRSGHHINRFIPCSMCNKLPSRLQCSYTFNAFCANCYSTKHAKSLPTSILDLQPLQIDYSLKFNTLNPTSLAEELLSGTREPREGTDERSRVTTIPESPGSDWHPFFDASGVIFFYNFKSRESMRRGHSETEKEDRETSERVQQGIRRVMFQTGPRMLPTSLH